MLAAIMLATIQPAHANEAGPASGDGGNGVVFFPIIFYTPETLGGGGLSVILFNRENKSEVYERNDSLAGVLLYTMRNQVLFALDGKKYFAGEKFLFNPVFSLARFPNSFFGTGRRSRARDEERYTPFYLKTTMVFEALVIERIYLGPALMAGYYELQDKNAGGLVEAYYERTGDRGILMGPGFQLTRDTRDSNFYPRRGGTTSLSGYFYRESYGSDYDFDLYTFTHRVYTPAPLNIIMAFELMAEAVEGRPPLDFMPRLGGDEMMRGFYKGRYSDRVYLAGQVEARIPVYGRWGLVLFGGAGDVYGRVNEVSINDLKIAGGGGVRFALNREKMINFRLDLGFAEGDMKVYFKLLEAF